MEDVYEHDDRSYKPPTKQDWKRNREKISHLYERMNLDQVMETMKREHGFDAKYVQLQDISV